MKIQNSLLVKILVLGILTLLLLIPLAMVKGQIRDRENAASTAVAEVSGSWGEQQTLDGPVLALASIEYIVKDGKESSKEKVTQIYPRVLNCDISADSQVLHRSIYDISVYTASVDMQGYFIIPQEFAGNSVQAPKLSLMVSDQRGFEGPVSMTFAGEVHTLESTEIAIPVDKALMDGKQQIPFDISYKLRGSSTLMVRPYGDVTNIKIASNCPSPSFQGDFLPAKREVSDEGFTAEWSVSKINRDNPADTEMGVCFMQGVTQYQKTERSVKYAILIILLVFLAGLLVEFIWKKEINILQYVVIGLSLVLFYALVLSFSEFISFGSSYVVAAAMTVAALFGYFRGILKSRAAYLLTLLVALAYVASYILLQMETYALISGTLLLFCILMAIMYFTKDLNSEKEAA